MEHFLDQKYTIFLCLVSIAFVSGYWLLQSNSVAGRFIRHFFVKIPFILQERRAESPYLTIFGFLTDGDGLGKVAIGVIKALKSDISIGFFRTRFKNPIQQLPQDFKEVVNKKGLPIGKVILYTDCYWTSSRQPLLEKIAKLNRYTDHIRIAYSMFETTKIPSFWAELLNRYFDAVVVPDPFLVEVYKNSGVRLPIFSLPMSIDYQPFFSNPLKKKRNLPFVFADFGVITPRKNQLTLIRAFAKAFHNDPKAILILNGRFSDQKYFQTIKAEIFRLGLSQVRLSQKALSADEYKNMFQSVDCYVSLSMGEGYCITVREAMAQGIPSICTDNSALSTICKSGLVRVVPSKSLEPAYFHNLRNGYYGNYLSCSVDDAVLALEDLYENYENYLQHGEAARQWVETLDMNRVRPLYRSLVKPKEVILGVENKITPEYLMTDSQELYAKYR